MQKQEPNRPMINQEQSCWLRFTFLSEGPKPGNSIKSGVWIAVLFWSINVVGAFAQADKLQVPAVPRSFPVRAAIKLVDLATQKPVPFASIRILGTKRGLVADSNGFFTIVLTQKDTLRISSLGYHDMYYIKDPSRQTSYYEVVPMKSKIFELDAVQIMARRNKDLSHPMVRWEYKAKFQPKLWLFHTPTGEPPEAPTLMSPISYLYDRFSRRGKDARKLRDMVAERARKKRNSLRYNPVKVQEWTGLQDNEIDEFMRFCPMPDGFLDSASDFEIIERTFRCLEDFDNREE